MKSLGPHNDNQQQLVQVENILIVDIWIRDLLCYTYRIVTFELR